MHTKVPLHPATIKVCVMKMLMLSNLCVSPHIDLRCVCTFVCAHVCMCLCVHNYMCRKRHQKALSSVHHSRTLF